MKDSKSYKKYSLLTLATLLVVSLIAVSFVRQLEFDFDFEKFFPANDDSSDFYKDYRKAFESDNDFVLIGLENKNGVFDQSFLKDIEKLVTEIEKIENVEQVLAITNARDFKKAPGTGQIYDYPILHINKPERYTRDSISIAANDLFRGTIVSKDLTSTALWIKHTQQISKEKCDNLSNDLHRVLDGFTFDKTHIMGRSVGQKIYVEMMQNEMMIFMGLSFILVIAFLFIAFRSGWGILIPIFVMTLAIIWNLAIIKLLGQKIDSMLTILPTIIFVVGMSDIVHFLTRYLAELRNGNDKLSAIKITIREVGLATLLTSLTTALGFLTLVSSPILPISNFGLYTAAGVIIAFILTFSMLPSTLVLVHKPKVNALKKRDYWKPKLAYLFLYSLRNRKTILWLSLITFVLSGWAISTIRANNYLLQGLNENHPLKQEMRFFEKNYSGARPLEVAVIFKPDTDPFSTKTMRELALLEDHLKHNYGLNAITSFHSILKKTDEVVSSKKPGFEDSEKRIKKAYIYLLNEREIIQKFYNSEKNMARIYGQTDDLGRQYYISKGEDLEHFMQTELKNANFNIKLTGTAQLIDRSNEILSSSMLKGLALAFLMIAILFGFLFKSWSMLVISLIPNILPLVMIGGVMGVSGIEFKVSNAIIFTIIFGIAVDDTIHFLSKFRMEIRKGRSMIYAMKRTFLTSGKAIIVTSLILIAGFLTLVFSDFQGTFYIGLLISLSLVFAVVADLLLLPVLIWYLYRER